MRGAMGGAGGGATGAVGGSSTSKRCLPGCWLQCNPSEKYAQILT